MSLLDATAADQDLGQFVSLFQLLSDKTRLNILLSLARGERNVTSLCEELRLPQPTVSHHLGLLRGSSVIANRRKGKQVFYLLNSGIATASGEKLEIATPHLTVTIARETLAVDQPRAETTQIPKAAFS